MPSLFAATIYAKAGYEEKKLTEVQYGISLQRMTKLWIYQMVRTDPSTCPITLQSLNFTIYSEYLLSLRRVKVKQKRNKRRRDNTAAPSRIQGAPNEGVGDAASSRI